MVVERVQVMEGKSRVGIRVVPQGVEERGVYARWNVSVRKHLGR